MSQYSTGELAKLCGVSVRTVQYYDSRGILPPTELSEGGRRLYSEDDLSKMKMICFLRELGLSINDIGRLLSEPEPEKIIDLILSEQEKALREEIEDAGEKLDKTVFFRSELAKRMELSPQNVGDIAYRMKTRKALFRIRRNLIIAAAIMGLVEYSTLLLWIFKGIWLPFVIGYVFVIIASVPLGKYYYDHTAYICPECHKVFVPGFKKVMFAMHTPKTRRLRCPGCGVKKYCVETVREEAVSNG